MPCRHCFPRFASRFARSSVRVLDRRMLVEIPHWLLFILGLNALTSKSPIPLRRRQLPWTRRIGSLTLRRSLMLWVVKMHSRQDWLCISLRERLKREYHSIRQTNTETSTEFMQRFLRLAGFLGAAAGTEEEQTKNFQWGLRRSTLNHHMCMSYTDVAHVANAARNYEILHERDDDDTER
nr:zinc finger, CCHC-type, retrotransposon Gag domain protein [Tanacetum cinerariifolium]